jgi:hypothetical protein
MESILTGQESQDDMYRDAVDQFGSSLERLASAYEADPEKRRDLSQNIHFQLWRSFGRYDARCSLRTWIYRVAHHVALPTSCVSAGFFRLFWVWKNSSGSQIRQKGSRWRTSA